MSHHGLPPVRRWPGEVKQHKPSEPEGMEAQPSRSGDDGGTNLVPPEPKLPPKSHRGRHGERARQPGHAPRPGRRQHPQPLPLREPRRGPPPAPPCCRSPRCTGRAPTKARSHRRAAALGAARAPAHLSAAPVRRSCPTPAALGPAPLPPPHKGADSWQAAADGRRRGSNQLRRRCGMRRNLREVWKDTEICAVNHSMPHSPAPSGPAIGKELTRQTNAKRCGDGAVPEAQRHTPPAGS